MLRALRLRTTRNRRARRSAPAAWCRPADVTLRHGRQLEQVCLQVFGRAPDRVQPLGKRNNNCGSYCLDFNGHKRKCYETISADRAAKVAAATQVLVENGVPIPCLEVLADHIVFAEWIEGETIKNYPIQHIWRRMAEYQRRIHDVRPKQLEASDRRFLHLEWLLDRLERAAAPVADVRDLCHRIRQLTPADLTVSVVVPDFIPANIVERPDGEWVLVDNEFLAVSTGFEFDLLNTLRVALHDESELQTRYLDAYAGKTDHSLLLAQQSIWEIFYIAKQAGKAFVLGDTDVATQHVVDLNTRVRKYGH